MEAAGLGIDMPQQAGITLGFLVFLLDSCRRGCQRQLTVRGFEYVQRQGVSELSLVFGRPCILIAGVPSASSGAEPRRILLLTHAKPDVRVKPADVRLPVWCACLSRLLSLDLARVALRCHQRGPGHRHDDGGERVGADARELHIWHERTLLTIV